MAAEHHGLHGKNVRIMRFTRSPAAVPVLKGEAIGLSFPFLTL